ncbi:MAG TPA: DUF2520 domain-containing protein [Solirubrobacteraceae bacterium]|nr:DUF2520 domain-containing protein [Solirubrobacteraceae bacterium]
MTTQPQLPLPAQAAVPDRLAIVGAGRMGTALARALSAAAIDVEGPLRRGETPSDERTVVLLCVPDGQIEAAAAALPARSGRLVGHTSAATTLAALVPHEAFSLHPLMTVTAHGADFSGATAAIAGATARALVVAQALAATLDVRPVHVADEDRTAYHAAASIASNFLVTLEDLAERVARTAGLEREPLVALVQASIANWAGLGGGRALTGPIVRGDETTVARQRDIVAQRLPDDLELFDALTNATRRLAASAADRPPIAVTA